MSDDDYKRACDDYGDDGGNAIIGAVWAALITLAGAIAFSITWRMLG